MARSLARSFGAPRRHGSVRIPDDTDTCEVRRLILVQRKVSGAWRTVKKVRTSRRGNYATSAPGVPGTYRVGSDESPRFVHDVLRMGEPGIDKQQPGFSAQGLHIISTRSVSRCDDDYHRGRQGSGAQNHAEDGEPISSRRLAG